MKGENEHLIHSITVNSTKKSEILNTSKKKSMLTREAGRGGAPDNESAEEKQKRLNEEGKRVLAEPGPLERLKKLQEKVPELAEMGKKRDILKKEWEIFDKQMKDIAFAQALIDLAEKGALSFEQKTLLDESSALPRAMSTETAIGNIWKDKEKNYSRAVGDIGKFLDALAAEPENTTLRNLKNQGIRVDEEFSDVVKVFSGKVRGDGSPEEVRLSMEKIFDNFEVGEMNESTPEKRQLLDALKEAFPDVRVWGDSAFESGQGIRDRQDKQKKESEEREERMRELREKQLQEQEKKAAEDEKKRKKLAERRKKLDEAIAQLGQES